ncbi:hypothetical protein [Bradyrhizobium sp.]|uniref:hypothetical protein n=1 Tax=Bradyrhizobium sp. TaxID=376 RepID=UPI001D69D713|nr:hypothetical protein [Bradyrhizobium sp.]MBI5322014.1 hypothetical protein [Bradyrhizobium sp.]
MADKPPSQFGKRTPSVPSSPTPAPPAKRSREVVLLVMGTIAVGSTAYALMPRECTPAQPGTMPSVSSPSECPPRGSSSSSHGSSGGSRYSYSSGGSSGSTQAATTDASSSTVKRGGFGSFAHSFSSHFSFGG